MPTTTPAITTPPALQAAGLRLRFLRADEADRLVAAIRTAYGTTYDCRWAYDVDEIARRISCGALRSLVAVDGTNAVVGHLGLSRADRAAVVGEAGQAVVHPDHRGEHLFTVLKQELARWCGRVQLRGLVSEATAAHPYSQEANLALGASETGFLLGYIPASVSYRALKEDEQDRRQSVALFWLQSAWTPPRTVHPPRWHRELLRDLYAHAGLVRTLAPAELRPLAPRTLVRVVARPDHGQTVIEVDATGPDLLDVLRALVAAEDAAGPEVQYLDLRLNDPATAALPEAVHDELGFSFGGVLPEMDRGDVLRLQRLHRVQVDPSDIAVASDFGRHLLAVVLERRREA